ncbi:tRNA uridine(34) 5-carboxymethylaminomethyl modification radical SAM/GNAT enzyme Elp3 [Methanothrix sp.]|uniref:tRNA uridine(34) 5-carboxymethylaminomethyl modification radical SAM/GNAT enzyme Elp3 n=1 Tax=Methanothrix sp. TaxID=90426 RepID=UPI002C1F6BB5|nr:tRNA uridine(34) 5-carboxymethylaminomethyl modification radical SAM/GNAT enzyme Elp3 [Methanothrix sp.]HOK58704.1 tRNA uridine(34) 5-carboxymethylaminomethyl modification radical SAM/GNAT enzyme Elp3 [Methanothrix sp.]HOL43876.1 tRNA uridine(34) 5-carboxymethylaminomethyl modification radical SAM/GNAT enzyme Elp3 [Methanothrix sp.]HPO88956.1 tRNA uridine(34) 5-carboxymethylaminomethyl modification radical SAM/GNAT enzyme Elp3 [Methanothrix sp.]
MYRDIRDIVEAIASGVIRSEEDLEKAKRSLAASLNLSEIPGNPEILAAARADERDRLRLLVKKPTRTLSGVAVIAVMTSPARCPHGTCVPCPGGVLGERCSPQSYTGREPAALRAVQHNFDPYAQVAARLRQLSETGHPVDKAELILMGGTITSRPLGYQCWFVKRCLEAMNDYPNTVSRARWRSFREVADANSSAAVRNVGITFETRPDWCRSSHIKNMLLLGGTKVELGVQSIYDDVLKAIRRGHSVEDTIRANRLLREAGMKVGFHMMPGLPGSNPERDLRMFRELFESSDYRPDYLKIYPTLVIEGTELHRMWMRGEYEPLYDDEAAELVSRIKEILPRYTRLQRVQRDIPAHLIAAGVRKSNLRQLARKRLEERGSRCRCIRCREAGLRGVSEGDITLNTESYDACGAKEHFISFDTVDDTLVGFLRLRLGAEARIRELHVYGPLVPLGRRGGWQHRGIGARLIEMAEEMARDQGYDRISVTSGIGVRGYYASLGYTLNAPYMEKKL